MKQSTSMTYGSFRMEPGVKVAITSPITGTGTVPPPHAFSTLAYDRTNHSLYLFGGRTAAGTALDDFWRFDPATTEWTEIAGWRPPARYAHSMVYHPALRALMLVGGAAESGDILFNDTRLYQDDSWVEADPLPDTAGVAYHSLVVAYHNSSVYDRRQAIILLFADGQTWQYR